MVTAAELTFNNHVIIPLLAQLKGGGIKDDTFIEVWQSWVATRTEKFGNYYDEWKTEDFNKLIKLSRGNRDIAFRILAYLIHTKSSDRITNHVASSYRSGQPYEWE
ncbi:MAG: hypothetical protein IKQ59_06455 [Prevotella sp.]|nr:hypothetical protein [Prevotella sp.]